MGLFTEQVNFQFTDLQPQNVRHLLLGHSSNRSFSLNCCFFCQDTENRIEGKISILHVHFTKFLLRMRIILPEELSLYFQLGVSIHETKCYEKVQKGHTAPGRVLRQLNVIMNFVCAINLHSIRQICLVQSKATFL